MIELITLLIELHSWFIHKIYSKSCMKATKNRMAATAWSIPFPRIHKNKQTVETAVNVPIDTSAL